MFNFSDGFLLPPCLRTGEAAQSAGFSCLEESITHYTSLLLVLIALGAFIYILYGAFLYASAFGEESKTTQAKKVVTNALIGMGLAVLANILVLLVRSILQA